MKSEALFKCQHCEHPGFKSITSFLGHLASKHPAQAKKHFPPQTIFQKAGKYKGNKPYGEPHHD